MSEKTPWEIVKLARHPKRITSRTLISLLFTDFIELKGDRLFRDPTSIIGGLQNFKRYLLLSSRKKRYAY